MKGDQMGAPAVDPRSSQTTALKLDAVLYYSCIYAAGVVLSWASLGGEGVDVGCGRVGLAGGMGTRTGSAQGADRTCVRPGRNTGDRWSFSRRLAVRGHAQNRLASG